MAVYKVPQDVEADDKLLGPFTFRGFIYLLIAAMAAGVAFMLSKIFIGLALIPAPIIIFFVVLALPLRKDQPMETYLTAMVSFYFLKPRKRLWQPDGLDHLVEITAPKIAEPERAKDITGDEAKARLDYLSGIVDSRGWALRGENVAPQGMSFSTQQPALNPAIYSEADQASDMFEENTSGNHRIESMIEREDARFHQQVLTNFQQRAATGSAAPTAPVQQPQYNTTVNEADEAAALAAIKLNPYPEQMRQKIISPSGPPSPTTTAAAPQPVAPAVPAPAQPQSTSATEPSPDIIDLANNSGDMTVADVAHEAERRRKKAVHEHGLPSNEVKISLH